MSMDQNPFVGRIPNYHEWKQQKRIEEIARARRAKMEGSDSVNITNLTTTSAKEIDGRAIVEDLEAMKKRCDDFTETKAAKELPDVVEETETLSETCHQLRSGLNATLKRNDLLESKMDSLEEQVSTLKMIASNTIQHNELLEIKMDSLEERVAALDMMADNNIWDEADSRMTSDNFWEGSDGPHLKWVSDSEEDEREEDSETSSQLEAEI